MTVKEANSLLAEADMLAGEAEIEAALERLAREMTARLMENRPVMICVMNGGLIFAGQLLPRIMIPLEIDYIHATRYGHGTYGQEINWRVLPGVELKGRTVVLLDDILDEGITLAAISGYCREQGAAEVLTAVLVDKVHNRKILPGFKADFTGIETEDRFLFGYGLDYKGFWRNAPGIYAVKGG